MSTALPEWYTKSRYNEDGTERTDVKLHYILEVDSKTEVVQILNPGNRSVKWSSDCKYCLGCMESSFYPNHENKNRFCGGGGRGHCTCDYCF